MDSRICSYSVYVYDLLIICAYVFICVYLGFLAVVCRLCFRGGAQVGGVARHGSSLLLIGRLGAAGGLGGGQILTYLLPLSLLDVVPGRVLQVSLHL